MSLKLHLGCGHHLLDGWVNTDNDSVLPNWHRIKFLDVTQLPFPYVDNNFDLVFTEHLIEHITWEQGMQMLRECYRVLKPGGILRVTTPNFEFLIDLYNGNSQKLGREYIEWSTKEFLPWAPYFSPLMVINNFVRDWGHQFIYDIDTLTNSMVAAGFTQIDQCRVSTSDHIELSGLENVDRMPSNFLALESFVLEGTK